MYSAGLEPWTSNAAFTVEFVRLTENPPSNPSVNYLILFIPTVWLSGKILVSINIVTLRWTKVSSGMGDRLLMNIP